MAHAKHNIKCIIIFMHIHSCVYVCAFRVVWHFLVSHVNTNFKKLFWLFYVRGMYVFVLDYTKQNYYTQWYLHLYLLVKKKVAWYNITSAATGYWVRYQKLFESCWTQENQIFDLFYTIEYDILCILMGLCLYVCVCVFTKEKYI